MRSSCSLLGSVNRLATVTAILGYFAARTVIFREKEMFRLGSCSLQVQSVGARTGFETDSGNPVPGFAAGS